MLHHEVEKMKALVPLFLGALFGVSAVLVYERVVPATYPLVDASPVPSSQPSAPDHLNSSKMPPNTPVPDADLLIAQAVDDPEGVLHLLPRLSPPAYRRIVALAVLASLGNTDATIDRVATVLPKPDRVSFRIDALAARVESDAPGAIRSALALDNFSARRLAIGRLGETAATIDIPLALAQVERIAADAPELKSEYLSRLSSAWAKADPEAVLGWLQANVPNNLPADAANAALEAIAEIDAEALLGRLDEISTMLRPVAEKSAIVALVKQDPIAAITALEAVGPPGRNLRELERAMAETYAAQDPEAALRWARTRTDPRSAALEGVFRGAAFADYDRAVELLINELIGAGALADGGIAQVRTAINALMNSGAGDFSNLVDRLLAAEIPGLEQATQAMMESWPQHDGEATLEWAFDKGNLSKLDSTLLQFIARYGGRASPERAIAATDRVPRALRGEWIEALAAGVADTDTDRALSFLNSHRNEPSYLSAMGWVLGSLGSSDPEAGVEIIATTFGGKLGPQEGQFVNNWATRDPAAAAKWAAGLRDTESQMTAVRSIANYWSRADADSTLIWLLQLSNDAVRDVGLQVYLTSTARSGALDKRALNAISLNNRERIASIAIVALGRINIDEAQTLIDVYIHTPSRRKEVARQLAQQGRTNEWTNTLDLPR